MDTPTHIVALGDGDGRSYGEVQPANWLPRRSRRAVGDAAAAMADFNPRTRELLARLTPKEQACLRLVAKHLSSKEIAAELGIAKTSVDTYCNRARAKLGVSDRYEAARWLVSGQPLAGPRSRPVFAPAKRRTAAPPAALTAVPAAAVRPSLGTRAALGIGAMLAIVIAIATLISGLRALEVMKPPPRAPAPASQMD